jgi:hypothetical protein
MSVGSRRTFQLQAGQPQLGRVVATPNALGSLSQEDITQALDRHVTGDWGEVCPADWQENELSLKEGFRLLSAYRGSDGTKFWVITAFP